MMWKRLLIIGLLCLPLFFSTQIHAQGCDPAVDYIKIGDVAYSQKDHNATLAAYTCAVTLGQANADVYNRLGNTHRDVGDYSGALADYNQAIALVPGYAAYYNNRGWLYYLLGDYDAAIDDFDTAIELNPDFAYAYNNRGLAHYAQHDYALALADFDRVIALGTEPRDWAVANRENVLAAMGSTSQSTPTLIPTTAANTPAPTTSTASNPVTTPAPTISAPATSAPAAAVTPAPTVAAPSSSFNSADFRDVYETAMDAYREGDYETSTTAFSQAVNLDADNMEVQSHRAYSYMVIGSYDYAVIYFTRAIELGDYTDYIFRAYSHLYAGNQEAALADYNMAWQNGSYNADMQRYLYTMFVYYALRERPEQNVPSVEEWLNYFEFVSDEISLTPDEPITVEMDYYHAYKFVFKGHPETFTTITAASPDLNVDAMMIMFNSAGELVTFNDDSDLGFDSILQTYLNFEILEEDVYTVYVTHAGGGHFGDVVVTLTEGE